MSFLNLTYARELSKFVLRDIFILYQDFVIFCSTDVPDLFKQSLILDLLDSFLMVHCY